MRILHLTLVRHWFDEIASGRKTEEYRRRTPYWEARLLDKNDRAKFAVFDEVHFRNGYSQNAPFMRVEFKGCYHIERGCYGRTLAIELGKILEIKNHK